jgi:Fic family protein
VTAYRWKPIEDLPPDWKSICFPDVEALASVWQEQAASLQDSDALKEFNRRLRREWAIETGIIENLYTIDRRVTLLLIEKGIESSLIPFGTTDKGPELIVSFIKDQEEALEGLFDFVASRRELSTSYIKELHQLLTRHQETVEAVNGLRRIVEVPLLRGDWKKQPNSPTRADGIVHEYAPPEQVASEMDRLIEYHLQHIAASVPPEVESAWLHHRFTQIHPFQDGNGRVARALASLVFLRTRWFPLVVHRDDRADYIQSLERADTGDLSDLVKLFSTIQRRAITKALGVSDTVLHKEDPLQEIISAAGDRIAARRAEQDRQLDAVTQVTTKLFEIAAKKLESVAGSITGLGIRAEVDSSYQHHRRGGWFNNQIVEIAQHLDYHPDTRTYSEWQRLKMEEDRKTEIVVSFHVLGVRFAGVMAASGFLEYRDETEGDETAVEGPYALCKEPFQYTFKEPQDSVVRRFREWLESVLIQGLELWRKQL